LNVPLKVGSQEATTISTTVGTSATSSINFAASEDLEGGMKAEALYQLDPRALANDNGAIGRHQAFVGLSGGFGAIKLGSPNSVAFTTWATGSLLGTGVGSGYAWTGGGTGVNQALDTRYNRALRYDSPAIAGLTVSLGYNPGNDVSYVAKETPLAPIQRSATEIGLRYAQGPITVALAQSTLAANANKAGDTAAAASALDDAAERKTTVLAASFKMGAATLAATHVTSEIGTLEGTVMGISASYTMGKATVMGHMQNSVIDNAGTETKPTLMGLRADYALSKRTAAYAGYEAFDNGESTNNDRTIMSLGVRHSF
jgi:predicted porin